MPLLIFLLIAATPSIAAQVPAFAKYPAFSEPKVLAQALLASNPRAAQFRTRIRESDKEPINFAGVFTVSRIGCGTSCAFLVLVDRRNGKVHFFPDGVLSWASDSGDDDSYGFTFNRNSRLLRSCGTLNESGPPTCWYHEWTDAGPKLVREGPWERHSTRR